MREANDLLRRLHDAYHAPADADIHQAPPGHGAYQQAQPGTARFSAERLVGSAAPEPVIERWDGIGPEGFGPVEILNGRTGASVARVNSAARRRMAQR